MSNIQKRGSYTPRRVREQKAFRLVVVGTGAGGLGALGVILAAAGVIGWFGPIVLIIVAVACYGMFRGVTS
jgi:chemotaxis response regulator CheB